MIFETRLKTFSAHLPITATSFPASFKQWIDEKQNMSLVNYHRIGKKRNSHMPSFLIDPLDASCYM
jgi:hypothetical protein